MNNIMILNDEQGVETAFEHLDTIIYKDDEYVVLLAVEESDEAGEVVILKLEDTEDEETAAYISVDDDTLVAVFNIFKDKFKDKFNFIGENEK